jgi:hypothetical protein
MNQLSSTASSLSSPPDPETVSRRAYELWEQEGRPEGCDLRHWLQAEQECRTSHASNETATTPTSASPGSDVRPLQGTRAAAAAAREPKRGSAAPFGERNPAGKRRNAATPPL